MLIGYVSDERYIALPDVQLEFENSDISIEVRSRASGAVHADIPPGEYCVVLAKTGYGSKRVQVNVGSGEPHQFRLLKDGLLGYAWPKWVKGGEKAEFRVHADEAYKLSLWRYGSEKELVQPIGWFDRSAAHGVYWQRSGERREGLRAEATRQPELPDPRASTSLDEYRADLFACAHAMFGRGRDT